MRYARIISIFVYLLWLPVSSNAFMLKIYNAAAQTVNYTFESQSHSLIAGQSAQLLDDLFAPFPFDVAKGSYYVEWNTKDGVAKGRVQIEVVFKQDKATTKYTVPQQVNFVFTTYDQNGEQDLLTRFHTISSQELKQYDGMTVFVGDPQHLGFGYVQKKK